MKQTQHTIHAYILADTRDGLRMREKDRLVIQDALADDHILLDFITSDACQELKEGEEVIMDEVEWDEPELTKDEEVCITFHLTISSNIEDEKRVDSIVFDSFAFAVPGYDDTEYSSEQFPR